MLSQATAPLVVAGGGAVLGDASAALTRIAELLQAPVDQTREQGGRRRPAPAVGRGPRG
ncbi:hypothetical protein ACU686_14795 [Yinghuangia aomiensis]